MPPDSSGLAFEDNLDEVMDLGDPEQKWAGDTMCPLIPQLCCLASQEYNQLGQKPQNYGIGQQVPAKKGRRFGDGG